MSTVCISTAIIEVTSQGPSPTVATCAMESMRGGDSRLKFTKIVNVVPVHLLRAIEEQNLEIDRVLKMWEGQEGVVVSEELLVQTLKTLHQQDDVRIYMERSDPLFWKHRLIYQFTLSPDIHSVQFISKAAHVEGVLFIEKLETDGCVAQVVDTEELEVDHRSLLTAKEKVRLAAFSNVPEHYRIRSEEDIPPTIQGLDGPLFNDLHRCLQCFLKDPSLHRLHVSFKDGYGYVTRGWEKAY